MFVLKLWKLFQIDTIFLNMNSNLVHVFNILERDQHLCSK